MEGGSRMPLRGERDPEEHENKLNASTDLLDADTDFIEARDIMYARHTRTHFPSWTRT